MTAQARLIDGALTVLVGCLAFGAGECHGRRSVHPTTCPAVAKAEAKTSESSREAVRTAATEDKHEDAKVTKRRYYPPQPGSPCKEPALAEEETRERATDTHATQATTRDTSADVRTEVKTVTVAAPLPRWSLGAVGGLTWTGERVYGGTAEVRVGPAWVGVNVTNKAAMGSLRWSW